MKKLFLLVAFISSVISLSAQKSFLYEVTGNGLEKPSYLFGTMHLMCKEYYKMGANLRSKLDTVDQLVLEIDMSNPMALLKALGSSKMRGDTTLDMLLGKQEYKFVERYLRDTFSIPETNYKTDKPIMLMQYMAPYMLGCSNITTVEVELMMVALKAGKKMAGLETVEEQTAVLDGMSLQQQADELYDQLKEFDATSQELKDLVAAYNNRDLTKLNTIINESDDLSAEMNDELLVKRNIKWIPIMQKMMKDRSCLFAFGAGHLVGEQGVINLLREAGYTVTKIQE